VTATPAQRTAGLATIYPAIKPWGTVYVDDREIGVTPPLNSFEVPPGRRLIIIKTSSLPAYHLQLSADPEAEISVTHDFACMGFGKGLERHRVSSWKRRMRDVSAETLRSAIPTGRTRSSSSSQACRDIPLQPAGRSLERLEAFADREPFEALGVMFLLGCGDRQGRKFPACP
jgi:hypothetical protein